MPTTGKGRKAPLSSPGRGQSVAHRNMLLFSGLDKVVHILYHTFVDEREEYPPLLTPSDTLHPFKPPKSDRWILTLINRAFSSPLEDIFLASISNATACF